MIYFVLDLSLTLPSPAPTMQPESSDGFASVGTILPEGRAALLPGGSFRFFAGYFAAFPASPSASTAGSVHCLPQASQSQEFDGSALSSTGSSAPQLGHFGGMYSGTFSRDSSTISCGIGLTAIPRASSSRSAATKTWRFPTIRSSQTTGCLAPGRSIQLSMPARLNTSEICHACSWSSHSQSCVFQVYSRGELSWSWSTSFEWLRPASGSTVL